MSGPLPPAVRAALDRPVLSDLWDRAAARLETCGRVLAVNDPTADAGSLSALLRTI